MNVEKEQYRPSLSEQASKLISTLAHSEVYMRERNAGESHFNSLETTAQATGEAHTLQEAALLDAMLKTGPYIDARQELASIESAANQRPLSDTEKRAIHELKEYHIIPFNHSVKEFINTHPNETIKNTSQILMRSYFSLYGKHDTLKATAKHPTTIQQNSVVLHQLEESINGMRHEIAAETMMAARDIAYSYDVSAYEDKKGTDLYFHDGTDWLSVNIKASDAGVASARKQYNAHNAISTGLEWDDFKGVKGTTPGALTISFATAEAKSDQFVEKLQNISRAHKQRKQHIGKKAVKYTR